MGTDGDIRMSSLKAATGIISDALSDHHPSGGGNTTKFGDFLVDGIGRRITNESEFSQVNIDGIGNYDVYLGCPSTTINGTAGWPGSATGGYIDSNGNFRSDSGTTIGAGDRFWVRVNTSIEGTDPRGQFFAEQIGANDGALQVVSATGITPTGNRQTGLDDDGYYAIDIQFEKLADNGAGAVIRLVDSMNTDVPLYGNPNLTGSIGQQITGLIFRTPDQTLSTTYISQMDIYWSNMGGSGSTLGCDLDFNNPLDSGGVSGDDTYSIRITMQIENTAGIDPIYLWLYVDDANNNLGCPGDGNHILKTSPAGGCFDGFEFDIPSGSVVVRAVITNGDSTAPSAVIDGKEVTISPDSAQPSEGSSINPFDQVTIIGC